MTGDLAWGQLAHANSPALLAKEGGSALGLVAQDTISGVVAFVVPGPDRYSQAQGVTDDRPGGVDAQAPDGMLETLDFLLPLPAGFVEAMAAGFATARSDLAVPGSRGSERDAAAMDRALRALAGNGEAVPLSLLVALMLNFGATSVNPGAVSGPFPSAPFANLRFAEKAEVFRRLEEDNAEFVALLDEGAPEPMKGGLSGQIRFMAGALLTLPAFLTYSEYGVFDRVRGIATSRPVGWRISRYMPGRTRPANGWDDFKGYYRGHRRARPTRRRRPGGRARDA